MKILLVADIFPPDSGGPASYVVALANELARAGENVIIASLNADSDESKVNCPVFKVNSHNKLARYWEFFNILLKLSADAQVIYAMGPVNAGLPAMLVAKLQRKKMIVKVVGDYAWEQGVNRFNVKDGIDEFQTKSGYGLRVRLLRLAQKMTVKKADKIIVPSRYLKEMVTGWGVKEEKIKVIYNAVNVFKVSKIEHTGEFWLVSAGRLVAWKGMNVLLEAVNELKNDFPLLKLKIVGDGPQKQKLDEKIISLSLKNTVELTGKLSRAKTLSYINSADLFVLNSGYEGLSHVLIEALGLDRPVLASDMGGNKEVVAINKKRMLFEYNNKEEIKNRLREFIKKGSFTVGQSNARARKDLLMRFSFEDMIKNTKAVLRNL